MNPVPATGYIVRRSNIDRWKSNFRCFHRIAKIGCFIMSVRPSTWKNSVVIECSFMQLDIWVISEKISFTLKSERLTNTLHDYLYTLMAIYRWFSLKIEIFSMDFWRKWDQLVTSYYVLFHFFYVQMFRILIYPLSWACDFCIASPHWSCVLFSICFGVSVLMGFGGIRVAGFSLIHRCYRSGHATDDSIAHAHCMLDI